MEFNKNDLPNDIEELKDIIEMQRMQIIGDIKQIKQLTKERDRYFKMASRGWTVSINPGDVRTQNAPSISISNKGDEK